MNIIEDTNNIHKNLHKANNATIAIKPNKKSF